MRSSVSYASLTIPENLRMIAVSGTLYRHYANLLRSLVQDVCTHNKIPDTQFGFILAEARCTCCLSCDTSKMQQIRCRGAHLGCTQPSLNVKQAYDSIPRSKLWDHLRKNQMPIHILSILKNLYDADANTLVDGDESETEKHAVC